MGKEKRMDQLILGLTLLCSPFEIRTEARLLIQHNCAPIRVRFVDETFEKVMLNHPSYIRSVFPDISKIVVATYYTERECNPAILYAVVWREQVFGDFVLVAHPTIFRDLDEGSLAR